MIVTCPECSTRYKIEQSSIGANGRTVRCGQCNASWFVSDALDLAAFSAQKSETESAAAKAEASRDSELSMVERAKRAASEQIDSMDVPREPTAPHVMLRDKADNQRRRRRLTTVAGIWAVPLLLISSIVAVSYFFRQEIVTAMPNTATAYKAWGIDVSLSGLTIEDPITRSAYINGESVLVINGAIKNISTQSRDVPLIELSLHSLSDEKLASWLVDTNTSRLEKGARASFTSEYPGAPVDAVELRYKFANETAVLSEDAVILSEEVASEDAGSAE